MFHAAAGISTERNAARAALAAAREAAAGVEGRADWCLAFVSSEFSEDVDAVVGAISSALDTPYVAGCSAAGVLGAGREVESGPAVSVLAVRSDRVRATPFLFLDEGDRGLTAGVRIGQRFAGSSAGGDALVVLPDPYHVRPDRLLHGLDSVLGGVPVVGGAASAQAENQGTFQFCGTDRGSNGVAGIRLSGSFRHAVGVTQGCRPLGAPLRVTEAHENLILELDGRPAFETLRDRAPAGLIDRLPWSLQFLFVGLLPDRSDPRVETGDYLVRNIVTADPDTGVLAISDRVEEGQAIVLAHREAEAARRDLRRMLDRVSPRATGIEYAFGIYFNCRARGRSLYGEAGTDVAAIASVLGDVPLVGFFGNAELAPLRGVNQLFTYTGVLFLVGR